MNDAAIGCATTLIEEWRKGSFPNGLSAALVAGYAADQWMLSGGEPEDPLRTEFVDSVEKCVRLLAAKEGD